MNAGSNSYIENIPPSLDIPYFHTNIIIPPDIIPAVIPYLLAFFQNNAHNTTGPNVAPNPAHANDTISNTELSGFDARIIEITDIITTVILATFIDVFLDILIWNTSVSIFCEILEAAASNCESAVDIVAARIPANITPAIMAVATPCVDNKCAIFTIIVSELFLYL